MRFAFAHVTEAADQAQRWQTAGPIDRSRAALPRPERAQVDGRGGPRVQLPRRAAAQYQARDSGHAHTRSLPVAQWAWSERVRFLRSPTEHQSGSRGTTRRLAGSWHLDRWLP